MFADALDRARAGHEDGWATLLRHLTPPALAYLRSQGVDDPDDVLGDALVEVVRSLDRFEGDAADFRSWFFVVVHSRAVDRRRRLARRVAETPLAGVGAMPALSPSPDEIVAGDLAGGDLAPLLAGLTDEQRSVVLLRVVGGLSAAEVGAVLGKEPDAVRALQSRALGTLRREISREGVTK